MGKWLDITILEMMQNQTRNHTLRSLKIQIQLGIRNEIEIEMPQT